MRQFLLDVAQTLRELFHPTVEDGDDHEVVDRDALVVLVARHVRKDVEGRCSCGFEPVGCSYSEHLADAVLALINGPGNPYTWSDGTPVDPAELAAQIGDDQ